MNLRQLQVLLTVAEAGAVTVGAERLHISQPAVSKHIRELEEELGTPLFDRHPRGVTLTAGGEVVLHHARRMLALQQAARDELAALRGVRSGRLAIGASTTIGSYLLPGLLQDFHHAHPGIRVSLVVANTRDIQSQLLDYALDLGLTEGFVEPGAFDARTFARDQLLPVASPAFAAAHRIDSARELTALPCILREPGSGTRAVVERAFARQDLRPEVLMSLGSTEAIKRTVAAGLGYAVISKLAVATELAEGRLVRLPVPELAIARPLHRIRVQSRSAPPALAAFVALLDQTEPTSPAAPGLQPSEWPT